VSRDRARDALLVLDRRIAYSGARVEDEIPLRSWLQHMSTVDLPSSQVEQLSELIGVYSLRHFIRIASIGRWRRPKGEPMASRAIYRTRKFGVGISDNVSIESDILAAPCRTLRQKF